MAGTALVPYGTYYEPNFTMGQPPVDPWTGGPKRAINLEPLKNAGRMAGRGARVTGQILGPIAAADVAVNAMNPLKMDKAGYEAYGNKLGGMANVVPPAVLGAVTNMFGIAPNSFNPIKQWKNNVVGAYNDVRTNLFGGKQQTPTAALPTQAIKGDSAYEGFDDQYRSFASVNAEQNAADARANAYTPAERQMLAISPNPYGTNEPYFDNAGIKRAGYDRMQMNTYDPKVAQGLPGMNPATGIGGSGIGAALQAAAARGDWDAVGRYYASQGQTFGGKMYGTGGGADMDQLYRTAMGLDGTGPQSYRKRDRAATILNQLSNQQNQYDVANLGAAAQRYGADQVFKAAMGRNAVYGDMNRMAAMQRDEASRRLNNQKFLELVTKDPVTMQRINKLPADDPQRIFIENKIRQLQAEEMGLTAEDIKNLNGVIPGFTGKADGGLVEGYARGGQVQPVLNPMGNMGMPSSMADLDPVIRQYAQYVSTASQYGLQPVAFPKFIDLLGNARTQLASMPTQGGATGFADGGVVDWLRSLITQPAAPVPQTPQQRLGQGAAMLGGGMAGQAAQALQGRKLALEEALQAAQGARMGYASGGAIPVAGRQVLGPGGPKSDSIPAVIDGSRPAGLSTGEFVMPTEAVQFYGTDKLNKMIQKARGQ